MSCFVDAFHGTRDRALLNCADHLLVVYLGLLALPFRLTSFHYGAIIAANVALGALAARSVAGLAAMLRPDPADCAERALVVLAFTLSPLLVACTVQLTPDFGVAVFLVCTVHALPK